MTFKYILEHLELGLFCRRRSDLNYYYFIYDGKNYNYQVGLEPENGKPALGHGYRISSKPVVVNGFCGYTLDEWEPSELDMIMSDWEVPAVDLLLPEVVMEEQAVAPIVVKQLDTSKPLLKRPPRQREPASNIDFDVALLHLKHGGIIEVPVYNEGDVLANQYQLFNNVTLMTRKRLYDKAYDPWVSHEWQPNDFACIDYRLLKAKDKNDS